MSLRTELHTWQSKIKQAVDRTRETASARRRQEEELISAVAHERALAHLFSRQPPPLNEVIELLRDAGEEDLVESECARRYAAFVEKKTAVFFSAASDLGDVAAHLSTVFEGRNDQGTSAALEAAADCGALGGAAQVHEFESLVRVSAALHEQVVRWMGEACASNRRLCQLVPSESNTLQLTGRKEALSKSLADVRDKLVDTRAHRAELVSECEAVLVRLDEIPHFFALEPNSAESEAIDESDPHPPESAHPLHAWQISAEEQQRRQVAADEEAARLGEKAHILQVQARACSSAAEWASKEAAAAVEKLSQLRRDCCNTFDEAQAWTRECEGEQERLAAEIENWKSMCGVLESQTEEERSKAAHVASARQKHHALLVQKEFFQAAADRSSSTLGATEDELQSVKAANQQARDELRYLSGLGSAVAAESLACSATVVSERRAAGVADYLNFVHRARAARENCQ